ncbi:hypothetical protein ACPRNU_04075 [Chromobacterium vaccinii]|uniref:hypothetical protein n=1 Tax=Chromobacterium vaccinii TaxID=1108595 RepID=UPI003C780190
MKKLLCAIAASMMLFTMSAEAKSLNSGQSLSINDRVYSDNGQYFLAMQADGNLVFYGPSGALWASNTVGSGAIQAMMQPDGRLVLYRPGGAVVWQINTGWGGSFLNVQSDGNLVFYRLKPVWDSHTSDPATMQNLPSQTFMPPAHIAPGNSYTVGQYFLIFQTDGNMVLYKNGSQIIWSSGTTGSGATDAWMQADGNFVIYANGSPVWKTNTAGTPNPYLALQADGNLVIYSQVPVWDRTHGPLQQTR